MLKSLIGTDLGIDLGTSKFSICTRSEGILCSEPAYVALQKQPKASWRVIAVGTEAEAMVGKSPPQIAVLCPMREGIIVDPNLAALLLQNLMRRCGIHRFFLRRPRLLIGSILGATQIERKAFVDIAASLSGAHFKIIHEPLAAAIGSQLPIDEAYGQLILDVGSGASEVSIVARGKIVAGRSIRIGGQNMDRAIQDVVLQRYQIQISPETARRTKESLSSQSPPNHSTVLSGFHLHHRRPSEAAVASSLLMEALQGPIRQIGDMVHTLLSELSPEFAVDVIEGGLHLSGGGAFTPGLREHLIEQTQLDVHLVKEPSQAVVRGCLAALRYYDYVS